MKTPAYNRAPVILQAYEDAAGHHHFFKFLFWNAWGWPTETANSNYAGDIK